MLVALGFLMAGLLGLLFGSALWSRAVRLTTKRIKASMPLSEAEIRADRDRLRAEFAVRVHKLETALEHAKLERARQFIEVNRRDAAINTLEISAQDLRAELDEHINARRVLEQTVSDRLPRVEARLAEAKRLLFNRDREIAELTATSKRQKLAMDEAARAPKLAGKAQPPPPVQPPPAAQPARLEAHAHVTAEAEAAAAWAALDRARATEQELRAEIEATEAKVRDQAAVIERLQKRSAENASEAHAIRTAAELDQKTQDLARLERKLAESEEALAAVRASTSDMDAARIAFESEISGLKSKAEDQAAEIARLSAALETYDRMESQNGSARESRNALKARLGSAQAQSDHQAATIGRLRAELAATQDRLARQAAHFMDEMRRVTQAGAQSQAPRRRTPRLGEDSIVERLGHVRPLLPEPRDRQSQVQALASQIKRAQLAVGQQAEEEAARANGAASASATDVASAATGEVPALKSANGASEAPDQVAQNAAAELPQAASIVEERRRPRLLDRLTGSKSQPG
jgi:chromosome segregation ATPase